MAVGAGEKFNHSKSNCVTDSLNPDHLQQEPNRIVTLTALVQQVPIVSERKPRLDVSCKVSSLKLFSFR